MYEVLAKLELPVYERDFIVDSQSYEVGATLQKKELDAARQTPDQVKHLVSTGAIREVKT
jgi:hypothetical protein